MKIGTKLSENVKSIFYTATACKKEWTNESKKFKKGNNENHKMSLLINYHLVKKNSSLSSFKNALEEEEKEVHLKSIVIE